MIYHDERVTVEIPDRQWTLKVGFDYRHGKYTLNVNGVEHFKLPGAPKTAKLLHKICRSTDHKNYSETTRAHTFVFFLNGEKHLVTVRQFGKSETLDINFNKAGYNKGRVVFSDIASYMPVVLQDEITGLKAEIFFDEEMYQPGQFVLDLDGEHFENFMFLDPTFNLEDQVQMICDAEIKVNKKIVTTGGNEWQPYVLQHAIWDVIDEKEPLTSVSITNTRETVRATMNEIIDLLMRQENIPEEGL